MSRPPLEEDLRLAIRAVREAGRIAAAAFGGEHRVRHKEPDQPVTDADLATDARLRALLLERRPDYGWLSEESAEDPRRLRLGRVWLVDPIDGTRSFIAHRPEFSLSVALVEEGRAVLGVVYNPITGELFHARRGRGAWREEGAGSAPAEPGSEGGRRLRVGAGGGPPVALASRSEIAAGEFAPFADRWRLDPVGSTAYKLALLAAGRGDVFLSRGPKSEWDICAGHLLVEEAGGRVTDLRGGVPGYNRRPEPRVFGILATNGREHDALLRHVRALEPHPRLARDESSKRRSG